MPSDVAVIDSMSRQRGSYFELRRKSLGISIERVASTLSVVPFVIAGIETGMVSDSQLLEQYGHYMDLMERAYCEAYQGPGGYHIDVRFTPTWH